MTENTKKLSPYILVRVKFLHGPKTKNLYGYRYYHAKTKKLYEAISALCTINDRNRKKPLNFT
jgi:hypothetical protein